ncbi:MAG: class I SAM-dependent methyltransferase, partial [Pyrinomonadaceae bacterium]
MSQNIASNTYKVYENATRDEMLPFVPVGSRFILDIGCSVGNFGSLLKEARRAEVWGVEIDERSAEIASARLDKVLTGAFDRNLELPAQAFDCIVFNDVLEHMVDPYSALEYAKELLSEDGCVVASIPNVRYFGNVWLMLVHGSWEYQDSGILDRTHLRFFTQKSIQAMFADQGYEIENIHGINSLEVCDRYFRNKFKILNTI